MSQFYELSLILLVSIGISTIMRLLKQPLVIGYILTGLIVGPNVLNILHSVEVVELFSKIGVTSLLFIVGLGLSPRVLKELGAVSTVTGVGQVVFTSIIGYLIGMALGFSRIESLYVAVALTFSSTIIILKLLSDKGDVGKLYGRIAIGFLLVQDLIATVILVGISSISGAKGQDTSQVALNLIWLLGKGALILAALLAVSFKILPKISSFIARSQEFLFMTSLSWGMVVASIYYKAGLSIEIGALVAGVTLSTTAYSYEISSRMKPLRDFFITLFFILLGSQMDFTNWQKLVIPTLVFSAFILIGNPLIVAVLMNLLGYTKKTGLMAGLTVAQISEFSLILIALGLSVGHLSKEILSMVTLIGIITISGSTYMILYSEHLYKRSQKLLTLLEFRKTKRTHSHHRGSYEAVLFGYRRAGPEFAEVFKKHKIPFLVVEYNPDIIQQLDHAKIHNEYGDASDIEFLQELPLAESKLIVSSIPDFETNVLLSQHVRKINQTAVLVVIADTIEHALKLYESGVTNVVLSHYIGAKHAAAMISDLGFEIKKYDKIKKEHIEYLQSLVTT